MLAKLKSLVDLFVCDIPPKYRKPRAALKLFLFAQGYRLALNYRLGHALRNKRAPLRWLAPLLGRAQYRKWACDISFNAVIGKRIHFAHPIGIVIGDGVQIGDDVRIFQQVTIGSHGRRGLEKVYPRIEDNVIIYAGAKVIGAITIGAGAIVGANAVVTKDVPAGAKVVGIPARVS